MDMIYSMTLLFIAGMLSSGLLAWFWQRHAAVKHVKAAQAKIQQAERRAESLGQQLHQLRQESEILQNRLAAEQASRESAVRHAVSGMRKNIAGISLGCLAFGLVAGSVISGQLVSAREEVNSMQRMIDLEVSSRVAAARSEMLANRLAKVESEYRTMRQDLFSARESEALTYAKLEILLNHLAEKKNAQGILLNIDAMRQNLQQDSRMKALSAGDLSALPGAVI